jgi:RNA polymerase sigma factor (sigma-70 family)
MTTQDYNKAVDAHADGLYRFVLKHIRDRDIANDIIQDTFEKVWLKHENIEADKAKSYLYTTAYRTLIDETRKQKKTDKNIAVEDIERGYENSNPDLKKIVDKALSTLPEIQRTVILLRDYEGYNYDEIGEVTSLNASQVKVYIYRARITLKEYIGKIENVL